MMVIDVREEKEKCKKKLTLHRVGLSGAGLTISKDANIVAVDGRLHELGYFLEDFILWYVAAENLVESELHLADPFPAGRSIHRALV